MKNTQTAHTPGPWRVEQHNSGIIRDGRPVKYFSVAHTSERRDCFVALNVAPVEIFFSVTGVTSPNSEGEANARLIAAAPEMLEALQALSFEVSHHIQTNDRAALVQNAVKNALLAIAKATGGTL